MHTISQDQFLGVGELVVLVGTGTLVVLMGTGRLVVLRYGIVPCRVLLFFWIFLTAGDIPSPF